jgi:Zn-dependent protease with chaperone function
MNNMSNTLKTVILFALLTALLLFIGNLLGGVQGLAIAFVFAILLNFGSLFFSDKIALSLYRAKPAPEHHELTKMVRHVAQLANVPPPKAYLIQSASPNAFATGRSPKHSAIAATTGIIDLLSKDDLAATLLQLALSRNREFIADATGAKITHKPYALASALHKLQHGVSARPMNFGSKETSSLFIINPFKGDFFVRMLSTHPPTEERIKRLKSM